MEAHTYITDERLKILIKIVFAEKFQTQGNFKMTMKEIKDLREIFFSMLKKNTYIIDLQWT